MTRGVAAAQHVIGSGFWGIPWANVAPNWDVFFSNHRAFFQNIWIVLWGGTVLIALAWNVRIGLFSIFVLAYLSSYPAIQFDLRHYFHLAFLTWLPVGIVLGGVLRASITALRQRSVITGMALLKLPGLVAWARAAAILMAALGTSYAVYMWGRHDQIMAVQHLFEQYLKATGDEAVVASKAVQGDRVVWTIDAPMHKDARRIDGHMLRLDIGGPNCTSGVKTMSVALSGPVPDYVFPGYVFKRDFAFDSDPARLRATVFVPVYFEQQRLTTLSLILPEQGDGCVEHATWLHSNELPPLWVMTTLYPDWHKSRLYQLR